MGGRETGLCRSRGAWRPAELLGGDGDEPIERAGEAALVPGPRAGANLIIGSDSRVARFGPTTPKHHPGLPLAVWRLDRP